MLPPRQIYVKRKKNLALLPNTHSFNISRVLVDTFALAVAERVGGCACILYVDVHGPIDRLPWRRLGSAPRAFWGMRVRCDIYDLSITIKRERAKEIKKQRKRLSVKTLMQPEKSVLVADAKHKHLPFLKTPWIQKMSQ